MTILYDGHIFRWQKNGGIVRYFREVVSRLPMDWTPAIYGVEKEIALPVHPKLVRYDLSRLKPRSITQPAKTWYWITTGLAKADVAHPTYYRVTAGVRFADIKCPVVITVHDFIAARYPQVEIG